VNRTSESGLGETSDRPARECGGCSLCCVVLRVPELDKLGGEACRHLRAEGGCGIHAERPRICRSYRCLWLQGGFREEDRPDRLGAVVDLLTEGATTRLSIQEASPGAFDRSLRLREIADEYRALMPVRVVEAGAVLDPDRPFRVLLADGEEHRVRGERIERYLDGERLGEHRMPWLERMVRRCAIWIRSRRLREIGGRNREEPTDP
jgi:hypothetical protein